MGTASTSVRIRRRRLTGAAATRSIAGRFRTTDAGAECEEPYDAPYDDEQDHDRCVDCKGSGWYVGFTERRLCPTCDGSGFL